MKTFLGQIILLACNYVPPSFALCDGDALKIASNQQLFSLIGTTYGGDGRDKFRLPDLRGKEPEKHMVYCICVKGGEYPNRS